MTGTPITDVANRTYDYVIAGGGTAGLTLAARLSEDPSVSVLVLEAGHANLNDPNILLGGQFGKTFGDPTYDWWFPTVRQPHSNDKTLIWSRGKGLGGSSGMNFYVWSKPPAADVNAIEKLGNPGWGWESFLKYSKKSETFHEPTDEQLSAYSHTFHRNNRGYTGPIQTSFPPVMIHTLDAAFQQTMRNVGLEAIVDPYGGDITGTWIATSSFDPKTFSRSYAATAYYQANQHRSNFTVLTEATVARVLFAERHSPKDYLTATGVAFRWGLDPSQEYVVYGRREVILSTGTIKNPQILELSGIGRKNILDRLGVDVKIDLPGVGENVQEHHYAGLSFEVKDHAVHATLDLMRDPEYAAQQLKLLAKREGMYGLGITSFSYFPLSIANPKEASSLISKAGQSIAERKASGKLPAGLAEQYDLQLAALKDDSLPDLEVALFPSLLTSMSTPESGKKYATMVLILNHPLSRGTIHAVSQDPMQQPSIDPHSFENDFDLEMLVQHIKFVKSMADIEPWKSTVAREVDPGPQYTTDQEIREYIKNTQGTSWHTAGSCSMLPLDKQGVVDPELKVYGTRNLRIVDISTIPIHIAAHTQTMAYVIAEKAADIIRGTS